MNLSEEGIMCSVANDKPDLLILAYSLISLCSISGSMLLLLWKSRKIKQQYGKISVKTELLSNAISIERAQHFLKGNLEPLIS